MTTNHTPGPWAAHVAAECVPDLPTEHWPYVGYSVFTDDGRGNGVLIERSEANARLIAAAPELLAALEIIVETAAVANIAGTSLYASPIVVQARAAIAKAKGE